jgi:hypothetical protein
MRNATRIIVSMVGILCGISGLEHGFFETLQGNATPSGLLISAIGPANRFWPGGTETALTVIPNFLITGILAMLASLAVIVWSAAFIQRKGGAAVFLLLSIFQFLVGGGFAQIFLVIVTAAAATQVNHPWNGWGVLLPDVLRRFMAKQWWWLLIVFALSLCSAIFAAIFGYIPILSSLFNLGENNLTDFLYILGYFMLGLLPLTILSGIAYDVENQTHSASIGVAYKPKMRI